MGAMRPRGLRVTCLLLFRVVPNPLALREENAAEEVRPQISATYCTSQRGRSMGRKA